MSGPSKAPIHQAVDSVKKSIGIVKWGGISLVAVGGIVGLRMTSAPLVGQDPGEAQYINVPGTTDKIYYDKNTPVDVSILRYIFRQEAIARPENTLNKEPIIPDAKPGLDREPS